MFQKLALFAALALSLLLPSRLFAGGPPWLCLPIEGVTAGNVKQCTALIEAKLSGRLWVGPEPYRGAKTHRDGDQQYLTFYMKEDVALGEIETALKGSDFSIPRDRIRLFGHAVLDIDVPKSSREAIASALDAMDNVSIDDSAENNGQLLVTVEMPYPVVDNRPHPENLRWERFAQNDYTSAASTKSASPIAPEALPGYQAFREVLAQQGARLNDVRWSMNHACRALGCVMAPNAVTALATATGPSSPK